jgi:Leucine-rich repeat (LRR) protein
MNTSLHLQKTENLSQLNNNNNLTKLFLQNCKINDWTLLLELNNLQLLYISYSNISNLEHIPKQIKYLYLNSCLYIKDFSTISSFTNLTELSLENTYITDITCVQNLKCLTNLSLYKCNHIKDFGSLYKLIQIEILDVGRTSITNTNYFNYCRNIKELYIEGCKHIIDFSYLSYLISLETLNLGYSNIYDLTPISNLINLTYLNLEWCKNITNYDIISKLYNLKTLRLNCSNVSDLSWIIPNQCLNNLDINYTKINDLSYIFKLHNLKKLILHLNYKLFSRFFLYLIKKNIINHIFIPSFLNNILYKLISTIFFNISSLLITSQQHIK